MKPNRLLFFFGSFSAKGSGNRPLLIGLLIAGLVLFVGGLATGGYRWYYSQLDSVDSTDAKVMIVKVKAGMTTGDIADILADRNLIRDKKAFLLAAKRAGLDKSLQAGEYELSRQMDVRQMIEMMAKGKTAYSQFTVPEGFTVEQIASLLEEKGMARKERFLTLAQKYAPFDKEPSRPEVKYRAEGFLYPDTYKISKGAGEEEILQTMAREFQRQFTPELQAKARASGLSTYDVIVLASLIEREVQLAKERPMVARVFLNRIKLGMPLQSCATIQYILGYAKEELTIADTQLPSPYNTYLHQGMPPGPVANPGLPSIQAALNPVEGDWLYFVVDGKTGGHRFSRTLAEHEAAIGQIGK
ncbi:MAG: endolytic transglycosylase MltG [Negativicutes bacterium]